MIKSDIKAIIFDVDGVVFKSHDENGGYLWSQSIKEDLGLTSKHFSVIFSEKWTDIIKGRLKLDDHLDSVFRDSLFDSLQVAPDQFVKYWLSNDNHINSDILRLVQGLQIPRYLGTNQEALRSAHILNSVGSSFNGYFASYEMGFIKPEKEFFAHIEKSLSLLPGELLLIDDTKTNVDRANDAGWHTYHYQDNPSDLVNFFREKSII